VDDQFKVFGIGGYIEGDQLFFNDRRERIAPENVSGLTVYSHKLFALILACFTSSSPSCWGYSGKDLRSDRPVQDTTSNKALGIRIDLIEQKDIPGCYDLPHIIAFIEPILAETGGPDLAAVFPRSESLLIVLSRRLKSMS